jgi:hypothetical protein
MAERFGFTNEIFILRFENIYPIIAAVIESATEISSGTT